jgi:serine/threonine protein kinase
MRETRPLGFTVVHVTAPRTEPQQLGQYRLVERIGEGGMGVVHLGVTPTGDLVAVKALRPWLVGGRDGRSRFEREVATLRRVRGDRIAEVLDADVSADPPFIVTRYVRGNSLDKVVADHGPLRGDALARFADGLAEALDSVHAAGVVHRDVKPGNVLITDTGPVLIDFGLARVVDEARLTATGMVIGTPGYLSPEVVRGRNPGPATDIHGWAATVAFAATGRPPYGTGPDAVILDRIRRGDHDLAGVEPGLAALLNRALAAEPERRPAIHELRRRITAPDADATAVVAALPPTEVVPANDPPTRIDPAPPGLPARLTQPPPRQPAPPSSPPVRPPQDPRPAGQDPYRVPAAQPPMTGGGLAPPLRTVPARFAVGVAWLVLLIGVAVAPRAGVCALFVVMVVARTGWRVRRSLHERRLARGYQPSDHWVMAAGTPWHLLVSAAQSALHVAWVALAAFVVGAAAALMEGIGPRTPYLAGATVAVVLTWFGPGTRHVRHGVRVLAGPLDRNPQVAWVLFGVLIAVGWVLLLVWDSYGTGWPPLNDLPNPLDVLLGQLGL